MYVEKSISDLNYKMLGKPIVSRGTKESFFECGGGFDTESSTIKHYVDNDVVIDNCFLYCFQFSIGKNIFILRTYEEFCNFIDKCIECVKVARHVNRSKKCKLLFFVANLSHEFAFLKNYFIKYDITQFFCKDKRNVLRIELSESIVFAECIGLFGTSLDNIAKTYCITQKLIGDLDYNLIRTYKTPLTETEKQYIINDVAILSELYDVAMEKFTKKGIKIPYTSTGEIRTGVKKRINRPLKYEKEEMKNFFIDEETHYYIRQFGYNGGLCGSNVKYVGEMLHNVTPFDLTSDYPAQMNHRQYPNGKLIEVTDKHEKLENLTNGVMCYTEFRIGKMTAKFTHYTLSKYKIPNYDRYYRQPDCCQNVVTANGKIVSADNVIFVGNEIDFKCLKQIYDIKDVSIRHQWKFTKKSLCPKHLRDNMNEWYLIKNKLKQNGQTKTTEYTESKKYVNGHYGLTATRLYKNNYDINKTSGNVEMIEENEWSEILNNVWLNPYIAYYTTSYAREILINFISKYPDNIVQYDTDSIYVQKGFLYDNLINEIDDYNSKISSLNRYLFGDDYKYFHDLGAWEKESECVNFLALGCKRYIKTYVDKKGNEKTETVIAGLPKSAFSAILENRNLTKEQLYQQIIDKHDKSFTFGNNECKKLTSKYDDRTTIEKIKIVDYLGIESEVIQTSYHALYETTFTLCTANDLLTQLHKIKFENTPKSLR